MKLYRLKDKKKKTDGWQQNFKRIKMNKNKTEYKEQPMGK